MEKNNLANHKQIVVCVTGCMAAGKNIASSLLENMGFASIDADKVAHSAIEISKEQILSTFSIYAKQLNISLLNEDGTLNRRQLGRIVFSSDELLKQQEEIIHPVVDELIKKFISEHSDKSIVINATVLYKIPMINQCDFIIFIDAPKILRFFRVIHRDKMPFSQIFLRFRSQNNLFAQYKKSGADIYKVRNIGRQKSLQKKLEFVIEKHLQKDN